MLNLKELLTRVLNALPNFETRTLLWTNPSQSSNYSAATVLDNATVSQYDIIEVEFIANGNSVRLYSGNTNPVDVLTAAWDGKPNYRTVTRTSSGISFSDGFRNSFNVDNSIIKPKRIYGIKKFWGGVLHSIISALTPCRKVVAVW